MVGRRHGDADAAVAFCDRHARAFRELPAS
jgi:hypothetical protein